MQLEEWCLVFREVRSLNVALARPAQQAEDTASVRICAGGFLFASETEYLEVRSPLLDMIHFPISSVIG